MQLTWATRMLHTALSPGVGFGADRLVTCNALCYMSCLNLDLYLTIFCAATLHFTPSSARHDMRERLSTIRQVNPTLFFGTTRYDYNFVVKFNEYQVYSIVHGNR